MGACLHRWLRAYRIFKVHKVRVLLHYYTTFSTGDKAFGVKKSSKIAALELIDLVSLNIEF